MIDDFEEISEAEAERITGSHSRVTVGGNSPPEPISDADRAALIARFKADHAAFLDSYSHLIPASTERLLARFSELQATTSAWVTQCPKITSQDQADACTGFGKQLAALEKEADEIRKEIKSIFDGAGAEIQSAFKPLIDNTNRCLERLRPMLGAWLKAEDDRKKREHEEAERVAAELKRKADAAAAEAARKLEAAERGEFQSGPSVNVMAEVNRAGEMEREAAAAAQRAQEIADRKVHAGGQYAVGGVKRAGHLSGRKVPKCSDPKATCKWLAKAKLDVPFPHEVTEAIEKAARRLFKTFPELEIPGVELVEEQKARF